MTDLPPPPGFAARRPTWDDLDDVAALYEAVAHDVEPDAQAAGRAAQDLRTSWVEAPPFDDALLAEPRDRPGTIAAYAAFHEDRDPWTGELDLYIEALVHPDHRDRGLATWLLARAVRRSRRAAPGTTVDLRTLVRDADEQARAWYARRGFRPQRHLLTMHLELGAGHPTPMWPAGVRCRAYDPQADARALWAVLQRSFERRWDHDHLDFPDWRHVKIDRYEDFDPSLVLLAEVDGGDAGEVIGAALCRPSLPERPGWGRIEDLGVHPRWQRKGVAGALLREAFTRFASRGYRGVALDIDEVDLASGVLTLYERAGMRVARREDVYVLEVPPDG